MDISGAIAIADADELECWLEAHGEHERQVVVAIFRRGSAQHTVTLAALQDAAMCHGWVDTQTQRIDAERYAIRFVPRRPGSSWSPRNRATARRLRDEGRLTSHGLASLPDDL